MSNRIIRSCKDFLQVHKAIKDNPNFKGFYGLDSAQEMVAELSTPLFVEKLKNAYPSNWHRLLDSICRLLGINKDLSYYGKLKSAVDNILSDPDYKLAQGYYEALGTKNPYYLNESEYFDETVQEQQRTNTLTDREVLSMAAKRPEGTPNLTEGERDALRIFQKRKEVLRRVLKKISKPIC